MQILYAKKEDISQFLERLGQDYRVFAPYQLDEENFRYQPFAKDAALIFNPYRNIEPLKTFFTKPREEVACLFSPFPLPESDQKVVLFGVKSCDLFSLKVQDFVFLEGVIQDSLYQKRRQNSVIISSDCTAFKEVCFCLGVEVHPYPEAGFDINLSPINDGYVVQMGSQKGKELVDRHPEFFQPATTGQLGGRRLKRENLVEKLRSHLEGVGLPPARTMPDLVRQGFDARLWQETASTCVECGGCNFICGTCHCFLLADELKSKLRLWDSCQYANFSRVAGGANPLNSRPKRLRNRFLKKFDFFPQVLSLMACCGCGRCIEVCPGKIDIREVLKGLHPTKLPTA